MTPAALTTRFGRTATPSWLQRSSPNLAATLTHGRKPAMPPARYALLPKIDNITKPKAFGSLALLCAAIERDRADQGLHLVEVEDIEFRDIGGLHRGVQVWTTDMANEKDRMLGYAWLDGAGREVLEPALRQARIRAAA